MFRICLGGLQALCLLHKVLDDVGALRREHGLRMELNPVNGIAPVAQGHDVPVLVNGADR